MKNKNKTLSGVAGGLLVTTLLAGVAMVAPKAKAEGGEFVDDILISVTPMSCTLGANVTSEHRANVISGQKVLGIGETTLRAVCNDNTGFAIYAIGASNGEYGNTNMMNSGGAQHIATGTYTEGNISSWGMKLTAVAGENAPSLVSFETSDDGYYAVPDTYTKVAYKTSGTGDGGASELKTTYYVYTRGLQPAGTYTGKVSYLIVHPNNNTPATIAQAFESAGKTKETVDGDQYYRMQDMTPEICARANVVGEASKVQLVDTRNSKVYWVTKLEDGHCWMTEDLSLNLSTATALTSENTDLNTVGTSGYGATEGYTENVGVISWTPVRSTAGSATTWVNSNTSPYSLANNGNYYNFTAAIATNDSSTWTSSTVSSLANSPQNSICPKGWRLPRISNTSETVLGSSNEFKRLNYIYNGGSLTEDTNLTKAPLNFVYNGKIDSTSVSEVGTSGNYWSNTISNSSNSYSFNFTSGTVNPENNASARRNGFAVRCVAR